jgi:hypothetical protein
MSCEGSHEDVVLADTGDQLTGKIEKSCSTGAKCAVTFRSNAARSNCVFRS